MDTPADGSLLERAAFLANTARPAGISNHDAHEVPVRVLGDVAIIHARTSNTRPDRAPGRGGYTDMRARRDDRRLAVAAQVGRS